MSPKWWIMRPEKALSLKSRRWELRLKKLAPETGLEPVTRRLIPIARDSTIEKVFPNPSCGFHGFDLLFSLHCAWPRQMGF